MKKYLLLIVLTLFSMKGPAQKLVIPNPMNYPLPTALSAADSANLGALIPRTMNLLAHGKKVKIAVYGQSLSDENNRWWRDIDTALRIAYPNADIDVRTYGVGGVASNLLWRLTNQELVAYHPDLVIFHVYGNHLFYETIIRQIRGCTTAEMIIQGDHFGKNDGTGTAGNWNYDLTDMSQWDNKMSFQIVKGYCDTYNLERDNRRQEWYDYLRAYNYVPVQMLKDDIHFNPQGQWLVANLTSRHFVYDSTKNPDPNGMVKYYEVGDGKDITITNGKIIFPFEGNKIEIVPTETDGTVISTKIDGKTPSSFANCYYFSIPSGGFWAGAPFIKPGMGTPQEEDWTLTMTGNGNFTLEGSKTGPDGSGTINSSFISNSKRVVFLDKDDWGNYGSPNTSGTYKFSCKRMFNDSIGFDTIMIDNSKENPINIVQGLENTSHTLELSSSNGTFPIKYIKVFKPAYKLFVDAPQIITAPAAGGTVTITVKGNTFWQASHNSNRLGKLNNWKNVQIQSGSDFAIISDPVNMTCTIPALTTDSAVEYVYVYGQGCDVKTIEIRQKKSSSSVVIAEAEKELTLYPNPAKDLVKIGNLNGSATVSVYSVTGTLVNSQIIDDAQFDISELPKGIYIVRITSSNFTTNRIISKE
jgi:hypothetical protein